MVLVMALTQLMWHALSSGSWRLAVRGIAAGAAVCLSYVAAFRLVDRLIQNVVPHHVPPPNMFDAALIACVAAGFAGVFLLQSTAERFAGRSAMRSLYVHAANGFYLDIPARRLTAQFYGSAAPTP